MAFLFYIHTVFNLKCEFIVFYSFTSEPEVYKKEKIIFIFSPEYTTYVHAACIYKDNVN